VAGDGLEVDVVGGCDGGVSLIESREGGEEKESSHVARVKVGKRMSV